MLFHNFIEFQFKLNIHFPRSGSSEKREFLKKRFSQLQDRNFCNSRDTSFEQYILNATNGEGMLNIQ